MNGSSRHPYLVCYMALLLTGTFGDVGAKYKNKYRSLVYNIKDVKNDGLFRRILLRDLSPIEVSFFKFKDPLFSELS